MCVKNLILMKGKKILFGLCLMMLVFSTNKLCAQIDSISICRIIAPSDSVQKGDTVYPTIVIKNEGTSIISYLDISCAVEGNIIFTEPIISNINVNDSLVYICNQYYVSPNYDYELCFDAINTSLNLYDSICKIIVVTIPDNDIGISQLLYPLFNNTVNYLDTINFRVKIKNYGTKSQVNFPVEYQVYSQPIVQEICQDTLEPNDSIEYIFNTTLIIDNYGIYRLRLTTNLNTEQNIINDGIEGWISVTSINENESCFFDLSQNYPNPANCSTIIKFVSKTADNAFLIIRDIQGRLVYNTSFQAFIGENIVELNTEFYPAGLYFYTLSIDDVQQTKMMHIINN